MDARIADLRRRTALNEPGARARLLQERLRKGELARDRVELAAALWDPDAASVVQLAGRRRMLDVTDLVASGREAVERGCVATVRLLVPCWREAFPGDDRIPRAVQVAEQLVLVPPERRSGADDVDRIGDAEHDAARALGCRYTSPQSWAAVAVDDTLAGVIFDKMGCEVVAGCARDALAKHHRRPELDARLMIHQALAADLVPWLLLERDPLRERVEGLRGGVEATSSEDA